MIYIEDNTYTQTLNYLDQLITVAFIIEAFVKIIAMGFLINGTGSYMRSIWNALDFLVVVSAGLSYVEWGDPQILKMVRLRRVLKPLSMINKNPGMKTVIKSLGKSAESILNLMLISCTLLMLFSILGTFFYSGMFWTCH